MSTTDLYLDPDEVEMFITATKKRPQSFIGGDEEGDVMYGVCPYISFYVLANKDDMPTEDVEGVADYLPYARERMINKVIDLHHALEKLVDRPYRKMLKNSTEVWFKVGDKRLPTDLRAEGLKAIAKDQSFWLQATDQDNPNSSARWAFDGRVTKSPSLRFTTLKITFRHGWYLENKATWQTFVKMALEVLQPEQCYSGFEMGSGCGGFDGGYEAGVMERLCTEYFYGVDIDHPAKMGYHNRHGLFKDHVHWSKLDAGLRTPTWCFLLSPYWMERLALTEERLYQAFAGQDVRIQRIRHMDASMSYWIQLGELDLHPVENGIPAELAAANRLIRPVRCDHLELTSLDPWDDDPNPRFDSISGPRWMARFDEDSQWPSPAVRQPEAPPQAPVHQSQSLSAQPGQPCPKEGLWFAPHLKMKEVRMKQGEPMPSEAMGSTGGVTWYFRG
jgi:hypothetical protein